jgi:hypothetical protein
MSSKTVDLYKQYVEAWSAISDQERRDILNSVLETDVVYRIPRMEGTGHEIVIEDMNEFQAKFPGGKFALHSVSEHHDVALMEWQLLLPDGTPSVLGHDAIRVTPGGKLGQIITFAPSTVEP